mmetsp:Transcript_6024/g.15325  ORF Transcript_6024/g.15325 Transcript_6024/m.15325 type:complete len:240 (+) Transcript_6024:191-910(+)
MKHGSIAPGGSAGRQDEGHGTSAVAPDDGRVERGAARCGRGESQAPQRVRKAKLVAVGPASDLLEPRAAERRVERPAPLRAQVARDVGAVDEVSRERGRPVLADVGAHLRLDRAHVVREQRAHRERAHDRRAVPRERRHAHRRSARAVGVVVKGETDRGEAGATRLRRMEQAERVRRAEPELRVDPKEPLRPREKSRPEHLEDLHVTPQRRRREPGQRVLVEGHQQIEALDAKIRANEE